MGWYRPRLQPCRQLSSIKSAIGDSDRITGWLTEPDLFRRSPAAQVRPRSSTPDETSGRRGLVRLPARPEAQAGHLAHELNVVGAEDPAIPRTERRTSLLGTCDRCA
jgi:hypothetical protein